ncbi:MAG: sulfatase-like hydrolase/transferase [Ruminococcus sp.]|nr:sulfatase-like hydrolase/transferase [Ruminococcus sp.]
MEKQKRFEKRDMVFAAALALCLGLTVFFFSPMEIVYGNQQDFTANASDILLPMLLLGLAVSAGLMLLFMLTRLLGRSVFFAVTHIFLGLTLAFYFQSLLFNGQMHQITGDGLYTGSTAGMVVNGAIFLLIAAAPTVIGIILARKKAAEGNTFIKYLPAYLCGVMILMQGFGFTDSMRKAGAEGAAKAYDEVFTYAPLTSLSPEKNTVVFLVDRFDGGWADELLEKYPELSEKLEGFTYYRNNISHYTNTFPSLPSTLTKFYFDDYEYGSKTEYLNAAWDRRTLPDALKENGVRVNLAIDGSSAYSSVSQLSGRCDNLVSSEDMRDGFNLFGKKGIYFTMTRLSLAKLTPYWAKFFFAGSLDSDVSGEFIRYKEEYEPEIIPSFVGVSSDLKFNDYITSHDLAADSPAPTVNIIHLNGSHAVSERVSKLYYKDEPFETDVYTTTRGEFEILFRYFDELKRLDIYDKTNIIIFADHGRVHDEIDFEDKEQIEHENVSALMVKPAGAASAPLLTDSSAELSNDYLAASVLEYMGIDHSDFGYSYNDIIEGDLHIERIFNPFSWKTGGRFKKLNRYRVNGDARDFSNWTEIKE